MEIINTMGEKSLKNVTKKYMLVKIMVMKVMWYIQGYWGLTPFSTIFHL